MRTCFLWLVFAGAAFPAKAQLGPARPVSFPVKQQLLLGRYGAQGVALPNQPGFRGWNTQPGSENIAANEAALPAPVPTVRAARAYAPLPARPNAAPAAATPFPADRYYPTSVAAAPPYDLYQNLPEEFRKRTLPAPRTEPLPLQLLRGALGR